MKRGERGSNLGRWIYDPDRLYTDFNFFLVKVIFSQFIWWLIEFKHTFRLYDSSF